MIPQIVVDLIKRLVAEDQLSYRKIARQVGVSRGSVSLIASGRRPDYKERWRRRQEEDGMPRGRFVRCPTCRHKVQMPCQICRARAAGPQPPLEADPSARGLDLELHGAEVARYEAIRRRRLDGEAA